MRIADQREMRKVRDQMMFCYLCGEPLPPDKRERVRLHVEHVVPTSLLTTGLCHNPWPVTLLVHKVCDVKLKGTTDALLHLLDTMHTKSPSGWPEQVRGMPLSAQMDDGTIMPAFTGAQPLIAGAFEWVRGMHAALYNEFLPRDTQHGTLPPVPATSGDSASLLQNLEGFGNVIMASIAAAGLSGAADTIEAWCGELRYFCTWQDTRLEIEPQGLWTCLWSLHYPGVLNWDIPNGYLARPWRGYYRMEHCPRDASILTQGAMDRFNRRFR
jgi:hypothetical protein